ncbi:ATP-binding cassette subfamily C member 4-like [Brevipalpus obovatus]|uniref:ATP-binding cassette subfamily C member 4-like n=1 Tax=Brevipalpus obovatus TaxID=246614 RepID=UPI003D9F211D
MEYQNKFTRPSPYDTEVTFCTPAFISRLFFCWAIRLFKLGYRGDIEFEHVYKCTKSEESARNAEKLKKAWVEELGRKNPNIGRAIYRVYGAKYILYVLLIGGYEELIIKISQPLLLGLILDSFSGELLDTHLTNLYLIGFFFCSLSYAITHHPYVIQNTRQGLQIRGAVLQLIMEKILVISRPSLGGSSHGFLLNLMAIDANKFEESCSYFCTLLLAPLQILLISGILLYSLGYAYLVASIGVIIFVIIQAMMGRKFGQVKNKVATIRDSRVSLMGEILSSIKTIKMHAWEKPYTDLVCLIRRQEMKKVRVATMLKAFNLALSFVTAKLILFACFLTYLLLGNRLTARKVFVTVALFNTVKSTLTTQFPTAISVISDLLVTIERINNFLLLPEVASTHRPCQENEEISVEVVNLTAFWDHKRDEPCLSNISFHLKPGELLIVIGPVGSGKTSLLLALLGEIPLDVEKLALKGKIGYVSQDIWTINASFKENIVLGKPFIPNKYAEVTRVSHLIQDIDLLPLKDKTMVGEHGLALSGGQKVRLALARALYQDADIYLFDDILAALDARVSNMIFRDCIRFYLRSKIVIMVTHHVNFLNRAEKILVLNHGKGMYFNGYAEFSKSPEKKEIVTTVEATEQGAVLQSLSNKKISDLGLSRLMSSISASSYHSSLASELSDPAAPQPESGVVDVPVEKFGPKKAHERQRVVTPIPLKIYCSYFNSPSLCSFVLSTLVITSTLTSQILFHLTDLVLKEWVNHLKSSLKSNDTLHPSNKTGLFDDIHIWRYLPQWEWTGEPRTDSFVTLYCILSFSLFVVTHVRSSSFLYMCTRAAKILHNMAFIKVMKAPMETFVQTPFGVGIMIAFVSTHLIAPALGLFVAIFVLRCLYVGTGRNMKFIEGKTKNVLYAHVSSSIEGLTTIRAFQMEKEVHQIFTAHLDDTLASRFGSMVTARLLGIMADWTCLIYILTTLLVVTLSKFIPPGSAGLALSQVTMLTGMFQWSVRQSTVFEVQMQSVERLMAIKKYPEEVQGELPDDFPEEWPSRGQIEFVNVFLQYSLTSARSALCNISLKIEGGEKIGIVGRTGSGKTSLFSCLYRLSEPQGVILIDDVNISRIPLSVLRNRISVIPQEPIIFSGTIRSNLDPSNQHTDEELWNVLAEVQLKDHILNIHGDLNLATYEGGQNMSVGQRQLMCLARVLLKKNKILMIDEATASMDRRTDEVIQNVIRKHFHDCTVLTNAHRLETIIDSDRVMVLDEGKLAEFDVPHNLLQSNTIFARLVSQTGRRAAQKLRESARKHFTRINERNKEKLRLKEAETPDEENE